MRRRAPPPQRGHALLDDTWTREQAYVALTRGKTANVLHVVADSEDELRDTLRGVLPWTFVLRSHQNATRRTDKLHKEIHTPVV